MPYNWYMNKNIKLSIISALFTLSALAGVEETYKALGLPAGTVKILSETSNICDDGPFKIVGEPGDEVLMLGPKISLALPDKDKKIETVTTDNNCKEDVQSQFVKSELHVHTAIHSCPPKLKRLESRVEEIVSVHGEKIKYQRIAKNEFRVECTFQWSKLDKK